MNFNHFLGGYGPKLVIETNQYGFWWLGATPPNLTKECRNYDNSSSSLLLAARRNQITRSAFCSKAIISEKNMCGNITDHVRSTIEHAPQKTQQISVSHRHKAPKKDQFRSSSWRIRPQTGHQDNPMASGGLKDSPSLYPLPKYTTNQCYPL